MLFLKKLKYRFWIHIGIILFSSNNPTMNGADAILQFDTDQGPKIVELSKGKLVELYMALQEAQQSLDGLLER